MTYEVGPRKYALDEGWGKLPEGYEYERVAGVAVDGSDRVYVFNRSSHPLMVLSREGELLDAWDRDFIEPHGAHVDQEGNVYLVDRDTYVVEKFSPGGELLLTLGEKHQPSDTGGTERGALVVQAAGPHNEPTGVVVSPEGNILVSDGYRNCRVHKYGAAGDLLMSWGVPGKIQPGHFHLPHGIGMDRRGRVLVCDRENHRIQVFSQEGDHLDTWSGFRQPTALAVGPDGAVFVSELQSRVSVVDGDGNLISRWGGDSSHEPGRFVAPHCIALDSHGDIYVGEVLEGKRIQKFVLQS
jgi:DNA-binding beta-propeller fold protein YncE